ncbi:leucine-rich repeat domain-containing protein [Clostridium cibarium]|uniref:Leucine-rich repeat domain-containing protein n=1 Tax=Clostridium cibarium TaxID=2762247 RepID=A0ABR8PQ11_9CLOT|nr:leucine-rich repeat domain-containing protein [Clostridium cibarium]MBD7910247.1 leucine-rich repeat domain-containing protein [Clostridium cibarium]
MKKGFSTMVAVIMAALLTIMSTSKTVEALATLSGDEIINITDTYFLQALRDKGVDTNNDGKISVSEMEKLQSLSIYDNTGQIADLSGIEYAKNITFLNLNVSSKIRNVNFVSNMLKLKSLGVYINDDTDNYTLDINQISNLTELGSLDLNRCGISDISVLKSLTSLISLSLMNNKITDISPLGGLINLYTVNLNYNNITDITPLKNLTGLSVANLSGNNISDAAKFDVLRISVEQMYKGQRKLGEVLPNGLLNGVLVSTDTNNIISLGDTERSENIIGLNQGSATIKLQYGDLTKTSTIKVDGIDADQPIEGSTDVTTEFYDKVALNSKGELWNLSGNGSNMVMNGVKKYVAYDAYEGDCTYLESRKLAIDNNNTLWAWAGDIYSTVSFQDNKREMENVKYVNTRYAVTYSGELWDYCKDDGKLLDNVKQVERINNYIKGRDVQIGTEVLKTDNTLWVRRDVNLQETSKAFAKVDDEVRELVSGGRFLKGGYIKNDGSYWQGNEGATGNIEFTKITDNVMSVIEEFIVKSDGTVMSPDNSKVVLTTGLKEVKDNQYLVDNNNTLWSWNSYSGAVKITDGFKEFTESGFMKVDGILYDYNNKPIDYIQNVFRYNVMNGEVKLGADNVLYSSGVKILTNVNKIYPYIYGSQRIYVARMDGSIWQVGDMVPTKLMDLSFDINHDGIVNMTDLAFAGSRYKATSTSGSYNSECDFNKDNIIDIYDIVTLARKL